MSFVKKLEETLENGINSLLDKCNDISKSVDESIANMEEEVEKLTEKKDSFCESADEAKESIHAVSLEKVNKVSLEKGNIETNLTGDLSQTQVCKTALDSDVINKSSVKLDKKELEKESK